MQGGMCRGTQSLCVAAAGLAMSCNLLSSAMAGQENLLSGSLRSAHMAPTPRVLSAKALAVPTAVGKKVTVIYSDCPWTVVEAE